MSELFTRRSNTLNLTDLRARALVHRYKEVFPITSSEIISLCDRLELAESVAEIGKQAITSVGSWDKGLQNHYDDKVRAALTQFETNRKSQEE